MMLTCPNGHASDAADFCSVCGVEMNAAPTPPSGGAAPVPVPEAVPRATVGAPCPVCGAARDPHGGVFCEVCGHNFRTGGGGIPPGPGATAGTSGKIEPAPAVEEAPAPVNAVNLPGVPEVPPAPAVPALPRWELVASAVPGPDAPAGVLERLFPLDGDEALIGRRSVRRNLHPEIALDADDGISHRHAKLLRQPDGRFAVLDLGSSNGTRLNGTELLANVLSAPLADGDKIELGRWSLLTLRTR